MAEGLTRGLTTSASPTPTANFFQLYALQLPLCRKFYISFILANSKSFSLSQNLKFVALNKTVIRGLTSVNSKFFHIALVECHNFKGSRLKISAPETSPNTDGIHIERSSSIYFSSSRIATGDDCISVGQGNSQVTITSITCGPGHGIRCILLKFYVSGVFVCVTKNLWYNANF